MVLFLCHRSVSSQKDKTRQKEETENTVPLNADAHSLPVFSHQQFPARVRVFSPPTLRDSEKKCLSSCNSVLHKHSQSSNRPESRARTD